MTISLEAPNWPTLLEGDIAGARANRADTLATLKSALAEAEATLRAAFEASGRSEALMSARSALYDSLISGLLDHASRHKFPAANPTKGEVLSAAAVGGYGRGTLAPFSDIDLLFLQPVKTSARSEQVI